MAKLQLKDTYLATRNGYYYFRRKLSGKLLRDLLKTQEVCSARQRAVMLYTYTNDRSQLGILHCDLLRLTKISITSRR